MKVDLYLGDCLDILPTLTGIDAVVTDPPYPDYYQDEYKHFDGIITPLDLFGCRQLVFWTAKEAFPLDYTAVHIWDKKTGCGSEYERIFERNGNKNYKMFREYLINSTVAASYTGDVFTGHKSQKPARLMRKLLLEFTNPGDTVLDPFMGSGTTGVACVQTGRNFIGIEIDPQYFAIAEKRIKAAQAQPNLFEVQA
jgi:DNA modification methylase